MATQRWALCLLAGVAGCLVTARADAQGPGSSNPQCVAAYEQAQVDKKGGRLLVAREHLVACSGALCPNWMQKECQGWLEDVERATPTVVLSAVVDGEERTRVQVELDGKPWVEEIGPRAMPIELGEHVLTFKVPGQPPIEKKVLLSEGEKLRRVRVEIEKPKPRAAGGQQVTPPPTPRERVRPVPLGVWIVGGVSLAALGASATLGFTAKQEEDRLQGACSPTCANSDVDGLRGRYLATNVVLSVGVAAAIGAVTWYLTRPSSLAPRSAVGLLAGGGSLRFEF